MSEPIECPYCAHTIQRQAMPYNETVKIQCPNCGGTFEYVPGFGTMTLKDSPSEAAAIEADRPTPRDTPPTRYRDPIFKEGRAYPPPRAHGKKPGKPFDPGAECARAFCITAALCGVCFIVLFIMMGAMLWTIPFAPYYP